MQGEHGVTAPFGEMEAFGRERKNPLTSVLVLVGDVGPICLIDAQVNKRGVEDVGGERKKKMHKPFSLAVDLELIL